MAADPSPVPAPPLPVPPNPGQVRQLMESYRAGQASLAAIATHLDTRGFYSEDADPRPVWVNIKGEWREYIPQSLLRLDPNTPAGKGA